MDFEYLMTQKAQPGGKSKLEKEQLDTEEVYWPYRSFARSCLFCLGLPRLTAFLMMPLAPIHMPLCLCRIRASCLANELPQRHGYGFVPVCIFLCLLRSWLRTNPLLQTSHLNCRSLRWVCTWDLMFSFLPNRLLQFSILHIHLLSV